MKSKVFAALYHWWKPGKQGKIFRVKFKWLMLLNMPLCGTVCEIIVMIKTGGILMLT